MQLTELGRPTAGVGQVVVRVHRAPVNPNDLLALKNTYEVPKPIGSVAGFEGSGEVVEGQGFMARMMMGRRVAFSAAEGSGSWAGYAVAGVMQCAPLRPSTTFDEGATMLTNPMTATVLLARAQVEGHAAVVQTAAGGALGKMMARLALEVGLPMIHVVRRDAQRQALLQLGCTDVLDSTAAGFETTLAERCRALNATLALDPVGGPMTGVLVRALAEGGVVRVYGALAGQPSTIDTNDLVFRRKRVEGFTMYTWLKETSLFGQLRAVSQAQARLKSALATELRATVPLSGYADALAGYERSMSGGKILFAPTA